MPNRKQLAHRFQSGLIIHPELPMDIINKIWSEVERRQDALARARHKLYMWAMYKFSLTEYLADMALNCRSANRLRAYKVFWGVACERCVLRPLINSSIIT